MMRFLVSIAIFVSSYHQAAAFVLRPCRMTAKISSSKSSTRQQYNNHDAYAAAYDDASSSSLSTDKQRRKLLSIVPIYTLPFLLGGDNTASAEVPTSTTTVVQQTNVALTSASSLCADSEEEARISIFERVAPSVVYIDTFKQKQDVFSTDVMEIPIGSGS